MITQAQIEALYEIFRTAAFAGDEDAEIDALTALDATRSQDGTPASESYAEAIGGDYIVTLDDGTIAAWGSDVAIPGAGRAIRDLVLVAPADQVVPAADGE